MPFRRQSCAGASTYTYLSQPGPLPFPNLELASLKVGVGVGERPSPQRTALVDLYIVWRLVGFGVELRVPWL